jgi:hypothetical protein
MALGPSVVYIMVGSNDFRTNRNPVTYYTDLKNRIAYMRTKQTRPCVYVLINAYEPWDLTGRTYAFSEYGAKMNQLATEAGSTTKDVYYVDLNPKYVEFMIPGSKGTPGGSDAFTDPFGLISSDKLHQNDKGHEQMARWVFEAMTGFVPGSAPETPGSSETADDITDTFARTSATSLQTSVSGQTWNAAAGIWGTDGNGAYLVDLNGTTGGVATIASGYIDVIGSADVKYTTGSYNGVRVRAKGAGLGLGLYFDPSGKVGINTVINGQSSTKVTVPLPAGITNGTVANLKLSAIGKQLVGYVNGVAVAGLTWTLSDADYATINGTDFALRQLASSATNGTFDNVVVTQAVITPPPNPYLAADSFGRTASTTVVGVADTGQTWTSATAALWGITAAGNAYLSNLNGATGGILNLPVGAADVDITVEFPRPASGFTGIAGRATGAASRIASYVDVSANRLCISTVESGNNVERAYMAFPTSLVAVGANMKLRLVIQGTSVNAYLNDSTTASVTYTLTGTQITGITGTDVSLRQTIAGAANGSFDNLTVRAPGSSAPTTNNAIMPTGDVVSSGRTWKYEYGQDFLTAAPLGTVKQVYGWDLFGYDGGQDTSKWGTYNSVKTCSAHTDVPSANGVLRVHPYWDATDQKYYIAALTTPGLIRNGVESWGQLYGRYSVRVRFQNVVRGSYIASDGSTKTDSGFKIAFLLWPALNAGKVDSKGVTIILAWDYGELNWPEGPLHSTGLEAYAHFATGSAGSRNHGNAMAYKGNADPTQWHTYTKEWTPTNVLYFLDGVQVASAPPSGVPYEKMFEALQIETWLDKGTAPPKGGTGDVEIDWTCFWSYVA